MIKKLLFPFIICYFLLTGCSNNRTYEEITFSSWGSVSEVKIIKGLIKNYEKENPNIKIKFIHIPQNYFQKIHLLFASNTAPDIIFINNLYLPVYESHLEDLTNDIDKNAFYPQAISGLSYNDKILAFPRDISNVVFYVNLDLLAQKGLSLPSENWTLNDLLNYAQKATSNQVYGISYEDDIYWALPYLNYFGGAILSDDLKYMMINSDKSMKGMNFYKNLRYKYKVSPQRSDIGSSTLAQMFLDKKIVFYLSGRWMFPKIKEKADFNWAIINFPIGEKGVPCDSSGWAIPKSSKHKAQALKSAKYLSNEKNSEYFAKTGLIVPARIEASKLLNNNQFNEKVFLSIIKTSHKTPVNKNYKQTVDKINKSIEW